MKISILGCGWLGFPLAKKLIAEGHILKGSTTSAHKLDILEKQDIAPFLVSLLEDGIVGDIDGFLENAEVVIIDVPPKLRGNEAENFVAKIKNLIPNLEKANVSKVLFISSTSVYGEKQKAVDETMEPIPDTEGGKQLLEVENLLLSTTVFETIILRFGGLIGQDRHPIRFLAGKQDLENPEAPINFIHQQDCMELIAKLVESEKWGEIYNAVAPFHPARKAYYTLKAQEFGLPLPAFVSEGESSQKLVLSDKITNKLNYSFRLELY